MCANKTLIYCALCLMVALGGNGAESDQQLVGKWCSFEINSNYRHLDDAKSLVLNVRGFHDMAGNGEGGRQRREIDGEIMVEEKSGITNLLDDSVPLFLMGRKLRAGTYPYYYDINYRLTNGVLVLEEDGCGIAKLKKMAEKADPKQLHPEWLELWRTWDRKLVGRWESVEFMAQGFPVYSGVTNMVLTVYDVSKNCLDISNIRSEYIKFVKKSDILINMDTTLFVSGTNWGPLRLPDPIKLVETNRFRIGIADDCYSIFFTLEGDEMIFNRVGGVQAKIRLKRTNKDVIRPEYIKNNE